jgi:hypothetical protein
MNAPERLYEMMGRLGIDPGILPQSPLRYVAALRCETCRSKSACQGWLDYAPAMVNFAPDFCANADMLFDMRYDQTERRFNWLSGIGRAKSEPSRAMADKAR